MILVNGCCVCFVFHSSFSLKCVQRVKFYLYHSSLLEHVCENTSTSEPTFRSDLQNDYTENMKWKPVTSVDMTVLGTQVFVQEKHKFLTITQLQCKSKSKTFNKYFTYQD